MRKVKSERFRTFHFTNCPFCGAPYQPDDLIFYILNELRICRLIECSGCRTVYCIQRVREVELPS